MDSIIVQELARVATVNTLCALVCTCKDIRESMNSSEVLYVLCKKFDFAAFESFSEFIQKYDKSVLDGERQSVNVNECIKAAILDDSVLRFRMAHDHARIDLVACSVILQCAARAKSINVFRYAVPSLTDFMRSPNSFYDRLNALADVAFVVLSSMEINDVVWFCDVISNNEVSMFVWNFDEDDSITKCELDRIYSRCDMERYRALTSCHPLLDHEINDVTEVEAPLSADEELLLVLEDLIELEL